MFSWDQVIRRIGEWQRRSRSRHELQGLSDATLRDIGITRCDAHREIHQAVLDGVIRNRIRRTPYPACDRGRPPGRPYSVICEFAAEFVCTVVPANSVAWCHCDE